jgi:hypothetical protein
MALTSASILAIVPSAHVSVTARTPALFIRASRLSQTILRPLDRRGFSVFSQHKVLEAVAVPRKFLARRTRQHYRNEQMYARPAYQQDLRISAVRVYQRRHHNGQSGRSWFWSWVWPSIQYTVWSVFLDILFGELRDGFVKSTTKVSQVKCWLTLMIQFRGCIISRVKWFPG